MNPNPANACTPASHDWMPSLSEAGVMVCAWPGCHARREASAAPVVGVDLPSDDLVAAVQAARAA